MTDLMEKCYVQECKSLASAEAEQKNLSGCFDCNICLDFAREPIVTLCGHLYCWPCIYKWLHVQSASLASDEPPQCPVCKTKISHTTMVPLYGRGQATEAAEHENKGDFVIPPRPAASGAQATLSNTLPSGQQLVYRNPYRSQSFSSPQPYSSTEADSYGVSMNGFQHRITGMFREIVYARVFGNTERLYAYPNSYQLNGSGRSSSSSSPRLRRHEMQADKSLNRISIFIFCFFLLCLVVF